MVGLVIMFGVAALLAGRAKERAVKRAVGQREVNHALVLRHWQKLETDPGFSEHLKLFADPGTTQLPSRFITASGTGDTDTPRDAFEQDLLDRFSTAGASDTTTDDEPEFAERFVSGGHAYEYYQPVRAERSCVAVCHGASFPQTDTVSPAQEGDLMAVVQVTIPR